MTMAKLLDFLMGAAAILAIPLAVVAYFTGNTYYAFPLVFTAIRMVRGRGKSIETEIRDDPGLHEKLKVQAELANVAVLGKAFNDLRPIPESKDDPGRRADDRTH